MATFSVKNFERFQHYKDRAPPWIKLYNELLDDYEFGLLPDASKMHLIAIWLLASRSDNKIPYDPAWVARRINATEAVDLAALAKAGFIVTDQPLQTVEHVASKQIAECLSRDRGETEERRGETDTPPVAKATRPAPSRFDDFWKAYPRRQGDNPRKPAEDKFNRLVKTGVDPQVMIDAVRAMASAKAGDVGTQFIPQAVTWLNQQRWIDHAAVAFEAEAPREMPIEDAVKVLARTGTWSRNANSPAPGEPGCKASVELLAKYGFREDGRPLEHETSH